MSNIKRRFKNGFTTTPNIIYKGKIGLQAIGLYSFISGRPDNWDFSVMGTCAALNEGRKRVISAIKDLEREGFLLRKQRKKRGKFDSSDWILTDIPFDFELVEEDNLSKKALPLALFVPTQIVSAQKDIQINKDLINKDLINKEKINPIRITTSNTNSGENSKTKKNNEIEMKSNLEQLKTFSLKKEKESSEKEKESAPVEFRRRFLDYIETANARATYPDPIMKSFYKFYIKTIQEGTVYDLEYFDFSGRLKKFWDNTSNENKSVMWKEKQYNPRINLSNMLRADI